MGKETGILLNKETGDLDIRVVRNSDGMIAQGIRIGDVTSQNISAIFRAHQGEFKDVPLLGIGIDNMLLSRNFLTYKHRIREHLGADGININRLSIDSAGNIQIDANY